MISICSLAPGLADRLSEIYDELKVCTDELQRKSLINELDIKRDLLGRMLEEARPVKRKRKESSDGNN